MKLPSMFKLPGVKVFTNKGFNDFNKSIDRKYENQKFENMRSSMNELKALGGDTVRVPYFPLPQRFIYDIADYSDIFRIIRFHLKKELFRNGYDIKEKFAVKCNDCSKEFENPVKQCDKCNSTSLRKPDSEQKEYAENFLKNCNENDMNGLEVSSMVEDDHQIVDIGYLQMVKDYVWDDDGELIMGIPVEIVRAEPIFMRLIADKTGRPGRNDHGNFVKTCLVHRDQIWQSGETHCPHCKRRLFVACYRSEREGKYMYYTKDEIYHNTKYSKSLTYGFPPMFSVWLKVTTLMSMDFYMNKYYTKQRPPRGLFVVNTPNMDSLQKAWSWMLKMFKKNPHMIPPLAIENPNGNKGKLAEFFDFMKSLDEMQFIEVRNEFRRQIGALFGVMPLYSADITTSGGLNNEGLQITITNRAIEDGQLLWNDGYYVWLFRQMEVTDYVLELNPNEEKDEVSDEDLNAKKIANAINMQKAGFEVSLSKDEGLEFEFSPTGEVVTPPEPSAFGDMGSPPSGDGGASASAEIDSPPDDTEFQGEPSGNKNYGGAPMSKDAPVTSSTPGVSSTVFSRPERRKEIEEYADNVFKSILKEEKLDVPIEKAETETAAEAIEQAMFDRKFTGVGKSMSEKIKDSVIRNMKAGKSLDKIAKILVTKGIPLAQANMIVRTENQAISNATREWAYKKIDPDGKLEYKWVGPSDHRTTRICKNISDRTVDGVSLDELRNVISNEVEKAKGRGELPDNFEAREWTPHFSCRHGFLRAF